LVTPVNDSLPDEPDELPVMKRRLHFGGWQLAGLALVALIPVLAMFRVFGAGQTFATAQSGVLSVAVDYPSRIRFGSAEAITLLVTNTGGSPADTVLVRFDSNYVARFSEPQFTPAPVRAYEVELTGMASGESRRVVFAFYAADYGRHRGYVAASRRGDIARVLISTFVLP
jgi:hypothetical protein